MGRVGYEDNTNDKDKDSDNNEHEDLKLHKETTTAKSINSKNDPNTRNIPNGAIGNKKNSTVLIGGGPQITNKVSIKLTKQTINPVLFYFPIQSQLCYYILSFFNQDGQGNHDETLFWVIFSVILLLALALVTSLMYYCCPTYLCCCCESW